MPGATAPPFAHNSSINALALLPFIFVPWAQVAQRPTTLAGYGITDAASSAGLASEASARAAADTNLQSQISGITPASIGAATPASVSSAISALGLGTAATHAAGDFQAAGSYLQVGNNLSDLGNVGTARTNLGLGSAATQASSAFDTSGAAAAVQANVNTLTTTVGGKLTAANNLSDVASAPTARTNLGLGALATANSLNTSQVAENTNLYFTNARAQAAISGTSPIAVTSGVVSIQPATTLQSGYLSSTDWNTFNSKQPAFGSQNANLVYAGPGSGGAAAPTWRGLVAADIPALAYAPSSAITGGGVVATGGYTLTVPATGTAALLGTANVFNAAQTAKISDAVSTITNVATLGHNASSGTPATGYGTGLKFTGQSSTTADRDMAQIASVWSTATDASRTSYLSFQTVNNAGALAEVLNVNAAGTLNSAAVAGANIINTKTGDVGLFSYNGSQRMRFGNSGVDIVFACNAFFGASYNQIYWTGSPTISVNDGSAQTGIVLAGTQAGLPVLISKGAALQTGDLLQGRDSSNNVLYRINKAGYPIIKKTAAPADADLNASEVTFWLQDTPGSTVLNIKAKDSGGTVRTATVALS